MADETARASSFEEQARACRAELEAERESRRQAEEARARSEGMFHSIVEALPMGVHRYSLEPDGSLIFTGANSAADRILGIDNRTLVGRSIEEAFPSLVGTEIPDAYRIVCRTGEPWHSEQVDYEDERIRGAFEVFAVGPAHGMVVVLFLDIAERKRAEKALRESEELYRLLVENAGDGIFIAQEGKVLFANMRAVEMAGYERASDVVDRSMLDFIYPEDHEMVRDRHVRRLRGEAVPGTYSLRMRRRDNQPFWTQLNTVLISWKGRPATLNFIRDIAELKKREEESALAERMRSIGTLAGGIAHDFNNILMGIQGNVSLLLLHLDPASPLRERLENIERSVACGAELTSQILGFARGGKYQLLPTDVNGLIRLGVQMFGRTRKEIVVHAHYADGLPPVEVDRGQFEQVLLNLFVNAMQAMPGGGEIFLETGLTEVDAHRAEAAQLTPGRYVMVTVRDTGCGIDPEVRRRIFEPFFTTKDRGHGTGLGLASAYGIIRNHGGDLQVQSEPGRGAMFSILLPASDRPVVPASPPPGEVVAGAGTVLLVDDEPMILSVCEGLLEHLGYEVLVAASGVQALEIFRSNPLRVDAVILDLVMAGMSGGETFDRLREIDPGIGVLLSSGYSIDSQARDILARGCDEFVQKPYALDVLSQKLRAVIERRRNARRGP